MRLSAGTLNQRMDIQSFTGASDGGGGTVKAWEKTATISAKVEPLNGGEAFRQGVANATQLYRVTIRFRTDINPANRLMWNGTALNIRTCADPDGRREALVMTVESGAAEPA
jgi:SPP1 family predicted phage head-tail adaptor